MRHSRFPALTLLLSGLLFAVDATAFTQQQHDTVIRLGELNGIALQCGYNADMRRLKKSLIDTVPKVSQLGDLYEDATQKSFLHMVQNQQPCPNPAPFREDVERAISALQQSFAQTTP